MAGLSIRTAGLQRTQQRLLAASHFFLALSAITNRHDAKKSTRHPATKSLCTCFKCKEDGTFTLALWKKHATPRHNNSQTQERQRRETSAYVACVPPASVSHESAHTHNVCKECNLLTLAYADRLHFTTPLDLSPPHMKQSHLAITLRLDHVSEISKGAHQASPYPFPPALPVRTQAWSHDNGTIDQAASPRHRVPPILVVAQASKGSVPVQRTSEYSSRTDLASKKMHACPRTVVVVAARHMCHEHEIKTRSTTRSTC